MNFNFTWLQDFLALAATGNFSRAAEDRHSSQPAFSRRIRSLEEWLGAPLVDRSSQPARLTEVGEWFKDVAEDLLARAARIPGEAKQVAEARSMALRIASTHALSFTFLPRWLRSLESTTAVGSVELLSDVLARCEAQMQQGKVHFVLSHAHPEARGSLDAKDYLSAQIGSDQLIAVSRPDARGRPLHRLGQAAKQTVPVLSYTEESGLGRIAREVLGHRFETTSTQVVFTAHSASVLRSMVVDGRGLAWLPKSLVEDDLAAGRLVMATDDGWHVDLEIRLYRNRQVAGPAAEALWESASLAAAQGLNT